MVLRIQGFQSGPEFQLGDAANGGWIFGICEKCLDWVGAMLFEIAGQNGGCIQKVGHVFGRDGAPASAAGLFCDDVHEFAGDDDDFGDREAGGGFADFRGGEGGHEVQARCAGQRVDHFPEEHWERQRAVWWE